MCFMGLKLALAGKSPKIGTHPVARRCSLQREPAYATVSTAEHGQDLSARSAVLRQSRRNRRQAPAVRWDCRPWSMSLSKRVSRASRSIVLDAQIGTEPTIRDRLTSQMTNALMRDLGMPGRQSPEDVKRVRESMNRAAAQGPRSAARSRPRVIKAPWGRRLFARENHDGKRSQRFRRHEPDDRSYPLLIAVDDETIPVKKKLETQALLEGFSDLCSPSVPRSSSARASRATTRFCAANWATRPTWRRC